MACLDCLLCSNNHCQQMMEEHDLQELWAVSSTVGITHVSSCKCPNAFAIVVHFICNRKSICICLLNGIAAGSSIVKSIWNKTGIATGSSKHLIVLNIKKYKENKRRVLSTIQRTVTYSLS